MSEIAIAGLIAGALAVAVLGVSFAQVWQSARARRRTELAAKLEGHRVEAGDNRRVSEKLASQAADLQQRAEQKARDAQRAEDRAGQTARKLWKRRDRRREASRL